MSADPAHTDQDEYYEVRYETAMWELVDSGKYARIKKEAPDGAIDVLAVIMRKSLGFQKTDDCLSLRQIAKLAGIQANRVGLCTRWLEGMTPVAPVTVDRSESRSNKKGNLIAINEDFFRYRKKGSRARLRIVRPTEDIEAPWIWDTLAAAGERLGKIPDRGVLRDCVELYDAQSAMSQDIFVEYLEYATAATLQGEGERKKASPWGYFGGVLKKQLALYKPLPTKPEPVAAAPIEPRGDSMQWPKLLAILAHNLPSESMQWLSRAIASETGQALILTADDVYAAAWIRARLAPAVKHTMETEGVALELIVEDPPS